MKKNIVKLFLLLLTASTFFGCNRLNLSNEQAKSLIIKELNIPYTESINFKTRVLGHTQYEDELKNAGIIEFVNGWLELTTKGNEFLLEKGTYGDGYPLVKLKTCDYDFNEITGIAIDKEQQTATVRFTLKAINITPVGIACVSNINNLVDKELVFKKFDTGWQLASNQNK